MPDGSSQLLPIMSEAGGRLPWLRSDWVFYASYLRWQRRHIGGEPTCLNVESDRLLIRRISAWAERKLERPTQLNYDFYATKGPLTFANDRLPDRSIWEHWHVCHVELDLQGTETSRKSFGQALTLRN
jgi:hypothetical protein